MDFFETFMFVLSLRYQVDILLSQLKAMNNRCEALIGQWCAALLLYTMASLNQAIILHT